MDQHHHEMLDELRDPTKSLRRAIPDTWGGFLGGGTASVYAPRAWAAFEEFRGDCTNVEAVG